MLNGNLRLSLKSVGFCVVLIAAVYIVGCQAQSKIKAAPPTRAKVKFSSVYTKLDSKNCEEIVKPESAEDEVPLLCRGYRDYKIYVQTHGISRFYVGREISKETDSWRDLELPSFLFTGGEPVIEWRLANGEPFAVIVRAAYDRQLFNPDEIGAANELVVQNLRGFATISETIDAAKNKRANEEARKRADAGYGKP